MNHIETLRSTQSSSNQKSQRVHIARCLSAGRHRAVDDLIRIIEALKRWKV